MRIDEAEARLWLEREYGVSRETMERLDRFVDLLLTEAGRQNLIAASTKERLWERHILDSAQLLPLGGRSGGLWLDLGTGAGFPGLVVAALRSGPTLLVEQRRLRADFLRRAAELMALEGRCEIIASRVERVEARPAEVISARAFAPLSELLSLGSRFSTETTRWVLPKGRNAQSELEAAESSWQGEFRLEPSFTDPDARIIVAERVRRRGKETRRK